MIVVREYKCGCKITTEKNYSSISYCPLHEAAPALYKALKRLQVFYETGEMDYQEVKQAVLSALAQAEGK